MILYDPKMTSLSAFTFIVKDDNNDIITTTDI